MPFICTLEPGAPQTATTFNSEAGQGETIVRIPVGYDGDTGAVFSSFTCLATVPGYGELRHELVFNVVKAMEAGPEYYNDGSATRQIIESAVHRAYILNTICAATYKLLDDVQPEQVVMMTFVANLPDKALLKYKRLANVLEAKAYVLQVSTAHNGRHFWTFTKP